MKKADMLLVNGRFLTMEQPAEVAEAVAIANGRILFVGARAQAEAYVGEDTQIVDLEGIQASKEEVGEAIAIIARQNGMTLEQLKPYFDTQFELAVVRSVLMAKAMKFVREHAEVTEVEGK